MHVPVRRGGSGRRSVGAFITPPTGGAVRSGTGSDHVCAIPPSLEELGRACHRHLWPVPAVRIHPASMTPTARNKCLYIPSSCFYDECEGEQPLLVSRRGARTRPGFHFHALMAGWLVCNAMQCNVSQRIYLLHG